MKTIKFYLDNYDTSIDYANNLFNVGHVYVKLEGGDLPVVTTGDVPSGFYGFYETGVTDDGARFDAVVIDDNYNLLEHSIAVSDEQYNTIINYIAAQIASPDDYVLTEIFTAPELHTCVDFADDIYKLFNPHGDIGYVFDSTELAIFEDSGAATYMGFKFHGIDYSVMSFGDYFLEIADLLGIDAAEEARDSINNASFINRTFTSSKNSEEYIIISQDSGNLDSFYIPSLNETYKIIIGSDAGQTIPLDNTYHMIIGGSGVDTAHYGGLLGGNGINVDLTQNISTMQGREGIKDYLGNAIKNVVGSDYDDTITGDTRNNTLNGGQGNDTLDGGLGKDILIGGEDVDTYRFASSAEWLDDVIEDDNGRLVINDVVINSTLKQLNNGTHDKDIELAGETYNWDLNQENILHIFHLFKIGNSQQADHLIIKDFQSGDYGLLLENGQDDFAQTTINVPINIDVLANDWSSGYSFDLATLQTHNEDHLTTVINKNTGEVSITPEADFVGEASFSYSLIDTNGNETSADVIVNITDPDNPTDPNSLDDIPFEDSDDPTGSKYINQSFSDSGSDSGTEIFTFNVNQFNPQNGEKILLGVRMVQKASYDLSGSLTDHSAMRSYYDGENFRTSYNIKTLTFGIASKFFSSSSSAATSFGDGIQDKDLMWGSPVVTRDVDLSDSGITGEYEIPPDNTPIGLGSHFIGNEKYEFIVPVTTRFQPNYVNEIGRGFNAWLWPGAAKYNHMDYSHTSRITYIYVDNEKPLADDDSAFIEKIGGSVVLDILSNDNDPDEYTEIDTDTLIIESGPLNGSLEINRGSIIYTPNENFAGTETITYTIADTYGLRSDPATATIKVINLVGDIYEGDDRDNYLDGTKFKHIFISGKAGNDILLAGEGNDTLNGGAGNDMLNGGKGFDWASYVDAPSAVTVNLTNGTASGGYGNDTLDGIEGIIGSSHNDTLTGNTSNNIIDGGDGNDTLKGWSGADTMIGGPGDDRYFVENLGDVVIEQPNQGTDHVTSKITYTLPANVENLTLKGSTSAFDGTGNDLANHIIGNAADNQINGRDGDDTLNGKAGNDTLRGWSGADTMIGGLGNDNYFVENLGDVVIEQSNQGTDHVNSKITYTLPANVENLTLKSGSLVIHGTGNDLNNKLIGNSANNQLNGGDGKDRLDGKGGADTLVGGLGNDIYVVDNAGDIVIENASEGRDKINSKVTYTLPDNVEKLTLTGSSSIDGTGNSKGNTLTGNSAANQLDGSAGNDKLDGKGGNNILTGGAGKDTFKFTTTGHIDTITDFDVPKDTIQLDNAVFTALTSTGTLAADQFVIGTAALDANDFVIYDDTTGSLSYDADGNGAGAAVQIAVVGTSLAMTNADIVVI